MIIDVDPGSAVPAFEQVRGQLAAMIRSGALAEGHRLPTIRQLAADLALAPGTVARVYKELEAEGLVHSRVRHGTVVAAVQPASPAEVRQALTAEAKAYASASARLGRSLDDAIRELRREWTQLT